MKINSPPKKWHVYILNLNPRVGTKPGKQRPCLAIQPDEVGQAGLKSTVVIPLTTKLTTGNTYPLRVRVPKESCRLDQESELLIDQILAWDNSLFRDDLGEIPEDLQEEVRQAIKDFLDLD